MMETDTEHYLQKLAENGTNFGNMADSQSTTQPELNNGSSTSPGSKRKRDGGDQSPDNRRAKRGLPASLSGPNDATGFAESTIESTIEAAQAAAAASNNIGLGDLSALQQATADHHDSSDPSNASSTATAALNSMYPTLHVPQSTEETFAAQVNQEAENNHGDQSFNASDLIHGNSLGDVPSASIQQNQSNISQQRYSQPPPAKLVVGSQEWHQQRKDNHKEVERRRRETINEGINELAKIVPGTEKNKGSILQRAIAFITQLKENEAQNIEKWTLEKLLTEQAIAELSSSNDKLKQECERAYRELNIWKQVAQNAGLQPPSQSKEDSATSSS